MLQFSYLHQVNVLVVVNFFASRLGIELADQYVNQTDQQSNQIDSESIQIEIRIELESMN